MDLWPRVANILLPVVFCWPAQVVSGADHWQPLRDKNPFLPHQPPAPVVEPVAPKLELRGVMVEGRVTWFNVYNAETKESAWVQRGDRMASFTIKDYDVEREALLLDYQQRPVSVALNRSKIQALPGSARSGTAVASVSLSGNRPVAPSLTPTMPTNENQRLEQVAEQIRSRREARRKAGEGSRT